MRLKPLKGNRGKTKTASFMSINLENNNNNKIMAN